MFAKDDEKSYSNPSFPGGDAACFEWLGKNIKYPAFMVLESFPGFLGIL